MPELHTLLKQYQDFTPTTAVIKYNKQEFLYYCLGLMGEHKEWKDSGFNILEAGDVMWYMSQLCNWFNISLVSFYEETSTSFMEDVNIAEHLKKHIRDDKNIRNFVLDYMRDVLSDIKYRYRYTSHKPLEEVMIQVLIQNRDKLIDRQNRDQIHGDGDHR